LLAVNPQVSHEALAWRKPLVGTAFAIVCVLGMLAALFPGACSKVFVGNVKRTGANMQVSHATASSLRGHHPECSQYSGHVVSVSRRVLCASCSGLFVGAIIALVGVGATFFGSWQIGQNALLAVAVGAVGVALGLLQSSLLIQKGVMRLFTGSFFVVGAFLILAGMEGLTHDVSADFLIVVLSIFWLVTKISFSKWDHERTCLRCAAETCNFKMNPFKEEGQ
jgi:hypothetical protein